MLATDRAHFVPDPTAAYRDSPQSIGHGATISAPHMHAAAAEALEEFCRPGGRVLDVGSGSGYFTSLVGGLVLGGVGAGAGGGGLGGAPAAAADAGGTTTTSPPPLAADDDAGTTAGGLVVGIEHIEALREMGERNVMKSEIGREWVRSGRMRFVKGDGRMGWREGAPWDAIVSFFLLFFLPCLSLFLTTVYFSSPTFFALSSRFSMFCFAVLCFHWGFFELTGYPHFRSMWERRLRVSSRNSSIS